MLAAEAVHIMETFRITALPVVAVGAGSRASSAR